MLFRVLGLLEVWHEGRCLPIGTPRTRAVLGILLARQGDLVSIEQIIDELWPDNPPPDAKTQVYGYVSRLRRALRDSPEALGSLVTRKPGYLLRVPDSDWDAHRFEYLVSQARAAHALGDLALSAKHYRQAHELWRGEPYADVPRTSTIAAAATALNELRLAAVVEQFDVESALGRGGELIAELTEHVNANPLREQLIGRLMLALYRDGRKGDAFAMFRRTRDRLIDELGVEPGEELQALHRRMLVGDASLASPPATVADDPGGAFPVPVAQLPPSPHVLFGRDSDVSLAVAALTTAGGWMPVCVVHGMAGVGKTALSLRVAHQVRPLFPDGQLWLDMRGADARPVPAFEALGRFLRALGLPSAALPDTVDERAAVYRSLLADRRVLVVIDNAVDEDQVRPLLPGTSGCAVVVTGRVSLAGLATGPPLHLDVLPPQAAVQLITVLGGGPVELAAEIAELCGYLPLALRVVAARIGGHPGSSPAEIRDRLRDGSRRLDELAVGASLAVGWEELPEHDKHLLKHLAALDVPSFNAETAGVVPVPVTMDRLDALASRHLLEIADHGERGPRRYRLHDLVRLFIRESEPVDAPAIAVMLDAWQELATVAAARLPVRRLGVHAGAGHPDSPATGFFDAERHVFAGLVKQAVVLRLDRTAVGLAEVASAYFELRSAFDEWAAVVAALDDVIAQAEPELRIRALCVGFGLDVNTDRLDRAEPRVLAAQRLAATHGDAVGGAHVLAFLGYIAGYRAQLDDSCRFYREAIDAFIALGDAQCAAISRQCLANALARQPGQAVEACEQANTAAAWFRANGDLIGLAGCHMALHHGLRKLGDTEGALGSAAQLRLLCERAGDERGVAVGQRLAGELHAMLGRPAEAHRLLTSALGTNRRMRSPSGVARTLLLLGKVAASLGRREEAAGMYIEAADLFGQMGRDDQREEALRLAVSTSETVD